MWARLARLLRTQGHEVFTPSLSGIGERAHLASSGVDLSFHTQDVLQTIEYERLSDFVLVGHSYGGMVVTAVADRVAEKIRSLVYLDAFVPKDGSRRSTWCGRRCATRSSRCPAGRSRLLRRRE